ncbi:MAG: glycosyl transferase [Halobacteriovorax sp.]|nr:glycosyl transferase [Halobacteriovorax sp.]|tara:strand:- start:126634 stop:127434 length:801 start_codon:yes stop_codon:yes gene_type:complete
MKISIVTPCWNSESTILRTLDSIKNQLYPSIEWIIVDNLSSDNTLKLIKENYIESDERSLKVISEKDKGISDAFNKGVSSATGEIVAILNSDDAYANEKIVSKVAEYFKDDGVDFVHGDMVFIDEDYGTNRRAPLLCSIDYAMPYNHPTMFLRKKLYDDYGLFDVSYRLAMDYELVMRMYESPVKCKANGKYLKEAMVNMYAGGMSDVMEKKSIDEVEKALRFHGFWSSEAAKNQSLRRKRIFLKSCLNKIGLGKLVALWRNYKWQ